VAVYQQGEQFLVKRGCVPRPSSRNWYGGWGHVAINPDRSVVGEAPVPSLSTGDLAAEPSAEFLQVRDELAYLRAAARERPRQGSSRRQFEKRRRYANARWQKLHGAR
jgi:hypothetical protein